MKKIKGLGLLLIMIGAFNFGWAQTYCQSFDGCGAYNANSYEHGFNTYGNGNPGCLSDWEVANGTPSIYSTQGAAYDGTYYALLGVFNNTTTEGIVLKYNFQTGKTYNVTMAIRNSTSSVPLHIDYVLLDAPINYTYNSGVGSSAIPAIPGGAPIAYTVNNFTSTTWQVVNFTISNLSANKNRLWIRQYGASSDYLFVDSLCINEVTPSTCQDFDGCGTFDANDYEHAFNVFGNGNPGCLSDWEVANGTPSIYSTVGAPYNGTYYALLGVFNNTTTEGIVYKHSFLTGNSYNISVAIRNNNAAVPLHIDFILLDAPINYTYNSGVGSSALPAVPSGASIVHTISAFTNTTWQVESFTISNLSANYNRLWIRQYGASSDYLLLDGFCIGSPNGIKDLSESREEIYKLQNVPNPFSSETEIVCYLPEYKANSAVQIYDITGKLLYSSNITGQGQQNIKVDTRQFESGLYLCNLLVDGVVVSSKKMVLAR